LKENNMDICPITNQPCNHPKVLHITDIDKGKITELNICPACSFKQEEPLPKKLGLLELLSFLFSGVPPRPAPLEPKCFACGTTPTDIAKTGKFGCPECYVFYHNSIGNVVAKCQNGALAHEGKRPKGDATNVVKDKIKNLEQKMANAISAENYEVAGVLKQKIQELRKISET
jgi:protein arginine kinase activator